ncbi:MAG: DoxX family protein [Pseudomonadales bacterium]|nr:DoxX family protein [Pseudomonadales bacterium]
MKKFFSNLIIGILRIFKKTPEDLISLSARLGVGIVFWQCAQSRITGWYFMGEFWQFFNLRQGAFSEFRAYHLPFLPAELAAYLATIGTFFFSLFLFIGFATRFSALGLFIITLVIQFFVSPANWQIHLLWSSALLYILKYGPGVISLDHFFYRKWA